MSNAGRTEMEEMTCFACGDGAMTPGIVDVSGERNGEAFVVQTEGVRCDRCGFATIDNDHSSEFTRLVSDAYREKHGLLTGAEIRSRRIRLGMSQQEFARYLGPGVASVKRWELGQIQDRAMDQLIRLKTDPEAAKKNVEDLRRLNVPQKYVISALSEADLTATEQVWTAQPSWIVLDLANDQELVGYHCVLAA